MAILKEFRCRAHGPFESFEAECPAGCSPSFVSQEIRTAPAFHNGRTARADKELKALAADFGMTDIKNDKAGGSVMDALRRNPQTASGALPVAHAPAGWSQRGEKPLTVSAGSYGAPDTDALTPLKDGFATPSLEASRRAGLVMGSVSAKDLGQ